MSSSILRPDPRPVKPTPTSRNTGQTHTPAVHTRVPLPASREVVNDADDGVLTTRRQIYRSALALALAVIVEDVSGRDYPGPAVDCAGAWEHDVREVEVVICGRWRRGQQG